MPLPSPANHRKKLPMKPTARFFLPYFLCLALPLFSGCGSKAAIETARNDLRDFSNYTSEGDSANLRDYLNTKKGNVKLWKKAAKKGIPEGQVMFGLSYFYGAGSRENKAEAVKWFQKAAEQGHAEGQYQLGRCYFFGEGISEDKGEGVKWIFRAKEQGHQRADALMQIAKEGSRADTPDVAIAKRDYRDFRDGTMQPPEYLAATKGNSSAWKRAAEGGNPEGQILIGWCYSLGIGVPLDSVEAVKWWRKAAEQGNIEMQFVLGLHYAAGIGVPEDMTEAINWLRKAAERGSSDAQVTLGDFYSRGLGVRKDVTEAVEWFRKAAEQGNAGGQYRLGSCYVDGLGIQKNQTEGIKWWHKAAEQGNSNAQLMLGILYATGEGVAKNELEAAGWFRKAAEQGNEDAALFLREIEKAVATTRSTAPTSTATSQQSSTQRVTCRECFGSGRWEVAGTSIQCPTCNGTGSVAASSVAPVRSATPAPAPSGNLTPNPWTGSAARAQQASRDAVFQPQLHPFVQPRQPTRTVNENLGLEERCNACQGTGRGAISGRCNICGGSGRIQRR